MWVQYWSLISHWVTPGNTSQFPFLDSTASATWKKTQVSKVIGDTDDQTLWLLWKNFYLHLRNNNLPIKTTAEVSNSLYMANKKQREGTLSYPVYLMMKRSRTLWSLTTPSTTSPAQHTHTHTHTCPQPAFCPWKNFGQRVSLFREIRKCRNKGNQSKETKQ